MDFGKIATKGQKHIPTAAWNAMREVAQEFENGLSSFEPTSANRNPFLIAIENATGVSIEPFAVLEISDAMFPNRTGTDFLNEAINRGVELKGIKPSGDLEKNIAITLDGGPNGTLVQAVVVGAVPCKVMVETSSAENYKYAVPVANQTGYLKSAESGNIRILWKESGTGTKEAYVCIDAIGTPEQEYFVINWGNDGTQTPVNDYSAYTKGSLHYIEYDSAYGFWKPIADNERTPATSPQSRPAGSKLVVCQVDAPTSAKEFHIPYYTPESNMGIPPKITSYIVGDTYITGHYIGAGDRCGVLIGEHEFTNKSFDYLVTGVNGSAGSAVQGSGLTFVYQPNFVRGVEVNGTTGGGNTVYADVYGESWEVYFPGTGSTMDYPDIYPYDTIMVLVDFESQRCIALDYSKDYHNGTEMPFWYAPGRGWDVITTPQCFLDLGMTLYKKVKTNAIL